MTVTRRSVLQSAAAVGALAASGRVFSPAIAQTKPFKIGILAPRSGIAAGAGHQRHPRHANGRSRTSTRRAASPAARSSS